jgi:putative tryptophan/tyrosine transport system substrate-binding protein
MRRRTILSLAAVAMVGRSSVAVAQWASVPVIGFLGSGSPTSYAPFVDAFRQGLTEMGYVEGKNVAIEFRWAGGRFERLPTLAADLVERKVDVIATIGGTPSARAAKAATATIPIVFSSVADPVGVGLLTNLGRPEGNVTGISDNSSKLTPKRLELLSELVPEAKAIALLVNPNNPANESMLRDVREVADAKNLQLEVFNAATDTELDAAFSSIVERRIGALVVASDPFFSSRREQLVALAAAHSVPAIYTLRALVVAGGLISYGASITEVYREAAIYVGKILKGTKPADLPVQQPKTFELVINLNTANKLGLIVGQSLRDHAELIE